MKSDVPSPAVVLGNCLLLFLKIFAGVLYILILVEWFS